MKGFYLAVALIFAASAAQAASSVPSSSSGSKPMSGTDASEFQAKGSQIDFLDFENDVAEPKPNGFRSVDYPHAAFSDSGSTNLEVDDRGSESDGQAIIIQEDDDTFLVIDFDIPMRSISMDFGNDDACCSEDGDEAVLSVFDKGSQVGESRVVMNRDDIMNQRISYAGACFTQATFFYDVDPAEGLIEIVDNIRFQECEIAIPALSRTGIVILALLMGVIGLLVWRRSRSMA